LAAGAGAGFAAAVPFTGGAGLAGLAGTATLAGAAGFTALAGADTFETFAASLSLFALFVVLDFAASVLVLEAVFFGEGLDEDMEMMRWNRTLWIHPAHPMGTAEKPQAGGMKRRSSDASSSFSMIAAELNSMARRDQAKLVTTMACSRGHSMDFRFQIAGNPSSLRPPP
jgi:hypothetical protein